jgi:hypothetical protein
MATVFNIQELKINILESTCDREKVWPFALTEPSRVQLANIARVSKGFSAHALNLLWRHAPLEAVCDFMPTANTLNVRQLAHPVRILRLTHHTGFARTC